MDAVDEITSLTNGLTRNIWQKIILLDRMQAALGASADNITIPLPTAPAENSSSSSSAPSSVQT